MNEFVGVKHLIDVPDTAYIKQEALMFHRIAIPAFRNSSSILRSAGGPRMADYFDDLDWLFDNGIIFEPHITEGEIPLEDDEYLRCLALEREHFFKTFELMELAQKTNETYCAHDVFYALQYQARRISLLLRQSRQIDAYPILYNTVPPIPKPLATKEDVVGITLKTLPVPDCTTPWEQIMEYRSDPDSEGKFIDLRNWMNETARAQLTPIEVEQKLEYLMSQYQRHMKLHRMKTTSGVLETTLVSTGDVIENLVKIKWGKLAKMLFSLKQRKLALLEGELTSPGSEIAYIIKTRESFI